VEYFSVVSGSIWRLLSWLPGFLFRRKFSKPWLAQHTFIDVRSRHNPIQIRSGELPELEVWLVVGNRGHFPIELDRLSLELTYGPVVLRSTYLNRTNFEAGEEHEIFLRSMVTREQVALIAAHKDRPFLALQLRAEFNCKIHNFQKDTGQLSGITPVLINF
jgi:hypothetical protein